MANPSISVDDEVLMEFDDVIWKLKKNGEVDRGASRSQFIQQLMEEWIAEQNQRLESETGNGSQTMAVSPH